MVMIGLYWGATGTPGWVCEDLNNDGVIDMLDVAIIVSHWGRPGKVRDGRCPNRVGMGFSRWGKDRKVLMEQVCPAFLTVEPHGAVWDRQGAGA